MNSVIRKFYTTVIVMAATSVLIMYGVRRYQASRERPVTYTLSAQLFRELGINQKRGMIVVAARADCPYCQRSRDFYEQLIKADATGSETHVIFVMPDPAPIARSFLAPVESYELRSGVLLWRLGVDATPTILKVDDKARISVRWVGLLNSKQKKEVLSELTALQHKR